LDLIEKEKTVKTYVTVGLISSISFFCHHDERHNKMLHLFYKTKLLLLDLLNFRFLKTFTKVIRLRLFHFF